MLLLRSRYVTGAVSDKVIYLQAIQSILPSAIKIYEKVKSTQLAQERLLAQGLAPIPIPEVGTVIPTA